MYFGFLCLQSELAVLYQKAGLKLLGMVFLMTDAQVPEERFLVLINDMLASGEIPDLFADDEMEVIINQMRAEVRVSRLRKLSRSVQKVALTSLL